MSFRRRLALIAAAAVAVAVLAASGIAYALVRSTLIGEVDDSLRQGADQALAIESQSLPLEGGQVGLEGALTDPSELPRQRTMQVRIPALDIQALYYQFVTDTGSIVHGPNETALDLGGDRDDAVAVATGQREPFFRAGRAGGGSVRVYTAQVADGLAVQVARSTEEVDGALGKLRIGLLLVGLAGIAVAALLGRLAARTAVGPVTKLTEAAEHVTETRDLTRRIEADGDDELARLARSFNAMLSALDDSLRAQRALVADASHELRTPLTSLRTNLEVLATKRRLTAADRDRLRADVVAQLEEMTTLVGDLVDLARADEPAAPASEEVRLDELLDAAVERAARHSPAVTFDLEAEPVLIRGDPARLDRAIANLLDNAGKWSPPDGTVEVRLRGGELTVRDHGPGIAPADRKRVFDRFYRADEARSRPGSGLGLAIVQQVAQAHGGSVSAEAAPRGEGALLRLSLPAEQLALSASS